MFKFCQIGHQAKLIIGGKNKKIYMFSLTLSLANNISRMFINWTWKMLLTLLEKETLILEISGKLARINKV